MTQKPEIRIIKPSSYQMLFQYSPANLTIAGAMAGVGKTYGVLLMAMGRALKNSTFRIGIFRDNFKVLDMPGGLIEESKTLYADLGWHWQDQKHRWTLPNGSSITFGFVNHLNFRNFSGGQFDLIIFDELQNFSLAPVIFVMSRLRGSKANKKDRGIFGTLNPEPSHFSRSWVDFYIKPDGFPNKKLLHKIIFYANIDGEFVFGRTKEDLKKDYGCEDKAILTFCFIPANGLTDNPNIGDDYERYLRSLPYAERMKVLEGNWNEADAADVLFQMDKINQLPGNRPEITIKKALSVDVARMGKDKAVAIVMIDNKIKEIRIFSKTKFTLMNSSAREQGVFYLDTEIDTIARRWNISNSNIIIDQDGLGGGLIDLFPNCIPFYNNGTPLTSTGQDIKEMYQNLKTQMYYKLALFINENNIKFSFVEIFLDNRKITELKKGKTYITTLNYIKKELQSIRIRPKKNEKYQINTKDEQKEYNNGQSPDIADALMMLMYFAYKKKNNFFIGC